MTSTVSRRLRGAGAVFAALLVVSLGVRPARAADVDTTGSGDQKAPASASGGEATDKPAADNPPQEARPVPQLQMEDEGPSAAVSNNVRHGLKLRAPVVAQTEERPFWKNWIFWTVTGVLVAGAVSMVIYSTHGTRSSEDACPAAIQVSLGCFGAGRQP